MGWLARNVAEVHAYAGLAALATGAAFAWGWPSGAMVAGAGLLYFAHRARVPRVK